MTVRGCGNHVSGTNVSVVGSNDTVSNNTLHMFPHASIKLRGSGDVVEDNRFETSDEGGDDIRLVMSNSKVIDNTIQTRNDSYGYRFTVGAANTDGTGNVNPDTATWLPDAALSDDIEHNTFRNDAVIIYGVGHTLRNNSAGNGGNTAWFKVIGGKKETYVDNVIFDGVSDSAASDNNATSNVLKSISYSPDRAPIRNNSLVGNRGTNLRVSILGSNNTLVNNIFNSTSGTDDVKFETDDSDITLVSDVFEDGVSALGTFDTATMTYVPHIVKHVTITGQRFPDELGFSPPLPPPPPPPPPP